MFPVFLKNTSNTVTFSTPQKYYAIYKRPQSTSGVFCQFNNFVCVCVGGVCVWGGGCVCVCVDGGVCVGVKPTYNCKLCAILLCLKNPLSSPVNKIFS